MLFSPFVVATSALHILAAIAAPVLPTTSLDLPLNKDGRGHKMTAYFAPETSQELVELAGRAVAEHNGQVLGYFGLPSGGHDMGFQAYVSKDAIFALSKVEGIETATHFFEWDVRQYSGNYCPEAATLCH